MRAGRRPKPPAAGATDAAPTSSYGASPIIDAARRIAFFALQTCGVARPAAGGGENFAEFRSISAAERSRGVE